MVPSGHTPLLIGMQDDKRGAHLACQQRDRVSTKAGTFEGGVLTAMATATAARSSTALHP